MASRFKTLSAAECQMVIATRGFCLGSFCWVWKFEYLASWFPIFTIYYNSCSDSPVITAELGKSCQSIVFTFVLFPVPVSDPIVRFPP